MVMQNEKLKMKNGNAREHLIRPPATFSPSDAEKGNPMGEGGGSDLRVQGRGSRAISMKNEK
jgi:hypothetical protein